MSFANIEVLRLACAKVYAYSCDDEIMDALDNYAAEDHENPNPKGFAVWVEQTEHILWWLELMENGGDTDQARADLQELYRDNVPDCEDGKDEEEERTELVFNARISRGPLEGAETRHMDYDVRAFSEIPEALEAMNLADWDMHEEHHSSSEGWFVNTSPHGSIEDQVADAVRALIACPEPWPVSGHRVKSLSIPYQVGGIDYDLTLTVTLYKDNEE